MIFNPTDSLDVSTGVVQITSDNIDVPHIEDMLLKLLRMFVGYGVKVDIDLFENEYEVLCGTSPKTHFIRCDSRFLEFKVFIPDDLQGGDRRMTIPYPLSYKGVTSMLNDYDITYMPIGVFFDVAMAKDMDLEDALEKAQKFFDKNIEYAMPGLAMVYCSCVLMRLLVFYAQHRGGSISSNLQEAGVVVGLKYQRNF